MTAGPVLIEEKEQDYAVLVDDDGRVIHNALQMDDPVIVRKYDDGMIHLLSSRSGQLIVAPFDPMTVERMRCPHCNGELGGAP